MPPRPKCCDCSAQCGSGGGSGPTAAPRTAGKAGAPSPGAGWGFGGFVVENFLAVVCNQCASCHRCDLLHPRSSLNPPTYTHLHPPDPTRPDPGARNNFLFDLRLSVSQIIVSLLKPLSQYHSPLRSFCTIYPTPIHPYTHTPSINLPSPVSDRISTACIHPNTACPLYVHPLPVTACACAASINS